MGILDFAKKQFIDILQWTETGDDVLAWRFPTADLEIQQGEQLIVRETQAALFVDQGRAALPRASGSHDRQAAKHAISVLAVSGRARPRHHLLSIPARKELRQAPRRR